MAKNNNSTLQHFSSRTGKYSMSFNHVITVIITLITLFIFQSPKIDPVFQWGKVLFLIWLYCFLALISTDWKELIDVLSYMLLLRHDSDINDIEQLLGIKNQLDIFNDLFNAIFTEMRIDMGKAGFLKKLWQNGITIWHRAYHGSISLPQGIWIFFYVAYVLLVQTNYFQIPFPLDAIATIWFFMGLCITSGHLTGVGRLIKQLFEEAHSNIKSATIIMNKIVDTIRTLCFSYNRISKAIERNTGKTVMQLLYAAPKREAPQVEEEKEESYIEIRPVIPPPIPATEPIETNTANIENSPSIEVYTPPNEMPTETLKVYEIVEKPEKKEKVKDEILDIKNT